MTLLLHRDLSPEEEKEYRQWARENYRPHSKIVVSWHPVVQDECGKIDEENPVYIQYERMSWPDYQHLMNRPDWAENIATIGDSDVLVPVAWIREIQRSSPLEENIIEVAKAVTDVYRKVEKIAYQEGFDHGYAKAETELHGPKQE